MTPEEIQIYLESYDSKMGLIDTMIGGMVTVGEMNSLVISGPQGIGKTYLTIQALKKYEESNGIKFKLIKGHIAPLEVYELYVQNSDEKCILVFDDADTVFQDTKGFNVLKAVTELQKYRPVNWTSGAASVTNFTFAGKTIILSNVKFNQKCVHYDALMDRMFIYNPKITFAEKIAKIYDIASKSKNLDPSISGELISFIEHNYAPDSELTIRTFIKLHALAKSLPTMWKKLAPSFILDKE